MDQSTRGAWMIGGVIGVVGAIIAVVIGLVGAFCCLAGMLNWVLPPAMGLIAGGIAAARIDWTAVAPGTGTGVGVGAGLRAGSVAALLTTLGYLVMAILAPILGVVINTLASGGQDLVAVLIASVMVMAVQWTISLVVAVVTGLVGAALGAAAGAVVGSSMGNNAG